MAASAPFTFSDLKPAEPIQGWYDFLEDGKAFLKAATSAHAGQKRAFTPEILYNIIAMAIEKFVMASLMRHGTMPYNHTMADLVAAMEETFPDDLTDIRAGLLKLDKYQDICDLEGFSIRPPKMKEIPAMLVLAEKMQFLATEKINA